MATVLYIKAGIKPEGKSRTFMISDGFINHYKSLHPEDEIQVLDLYREGIKALTPEDLRHIDGEKTEESRNDPVLKYAYQFYDADKYVIAAPQWNLGSPGILKCYLDYACLSGISFHFDETGSHGDLHGKNAVHITTMGGDYSHDPLKSWNSADSYLRNLFRMCGVSDFETIAVDRTDIIGEDVEKRIEEGIREARKVAETF